MPELTLEDVEYYAVLARLELTQDERLKLRSDLNAIVAHFDRLRELDVESVPPTSHAIPMQNVLRRDEARASFPLDSFLREAPDRQDDFFVVPRIVEG